MAEIYYRSLAFSANTLRYRIEQTNNKKPYTSHTHKHSKRICRALFFVCSPWTRRTKTIKRTSIHTSFTQHVQRISQFVWDLRIDWFSALFCVFLECEVFAKKCVWSFTIWCFYSSSCRSWKRGQFKERDRDTPMVIQINRNKNNSNS